MKNCTLPFVLALPLLVSSAALAQHEKFTADPATSTVSFTLGANDGDKHGTFHAQGASIEFDPKAHTIGGSVIVNAATGDSGNASRDKKMSKDVLDASHFAEVTFAPKTYTGDLTATGDSKIQVTGIFTLHGTPHEITVPVEVHIDRTSCVVKTKFPVPYVAWGLKDPSFMMFKVAKEVGIELSLAGQLSN
jgi:polyisoprenoid-binding protein YceI